MDMAVKKKVMQEEELLLDTVVGILDCIPFGCSLGGHPFFLKSLQNDTSMYLHFEEQASLIINFLKLMQGKC